MDDMKLVESDSDDPYDRDATQRNPPGQSVYEAFKALRSPCIPPDRFDSPIEVVVHELSWRNRFIPAYSPLQGGDHSF